MLASLHERKRLEGKTPKEALRCLKRRLSDVVYWQLVAGQLRELLDWHLEDRRNAGEKRAHRQWLPRYIGSGISLTDDHLFARAVGRHDAAVPALGAPRTNPADPA